MLPNHDHVRSRERECELIRNPRLDRTRDPRCGPVRVPDHDANRWPICDPDIDFRPLFGARAPDATHAIDKIMQSPVAR